MIEEEINVNQINQPLGSYSAQQYFFTEKFYYSGYIYNTSSTNNLTIQITLTKGNVLPSIVIPASSILTIENLNIYILSISAGTYTFSFLGSNTKSIPKLMINTAQLVVTQPLDANGNVKVDLMTSLPAGSNTIGSVNISTITHKRLGSVTSYSASANTNIFSTSLTSDISGYFYITIVTNTASVVNLIFNGITIALNQGNSLNANAGYTFALPMIIGDTLNVQFATAGTVSVWIDEGVV
jgi:hypothetical protein